MPPRIGTFGFARHTEPTLHKTKRANFADPPDNNNLLKTLEQKSMVISNHLTTFDTISQH